MWCVRNIVCQLGRIEFWSQYQVLLFYFGLSEIILILDKNDDELYLYTNKRRPSLIYKLRKGPDLRGNIAAEVNFQITCNDSCSKF